MRRRRPAIDHVPDRLRHFNSGDWNPDPWAAMHQWKRARQEWFKAHPNAWPDWFVMMAGYANLRRKLAGGRASGWRDADEAG